MKKHNQITRRCISCRLEFPRQELLRITKIAGGKIVLVPNRHQLGRSVYVCKKAACIRIAIKTTGLKISKMLRVPKNKIDENLIKEVTSQIA